MQVRVVIGIALAAIVAFGGCASEERIAGADLCPAGTTYACTSSVGKIRDCMCASREDLRDILDPVNDY